MFIGPKRGVLMRVVENKASSCCRGKTRSVTYSECVCVSSPGHHVWCRAL